MLLAVAASAQQSSPEIAVIVQSGRALTVAETPDARTGSMLRIPPGQPPLLNFRFYEGKLHHRFGNGELLLDDAGH